MPTDLFVDIYSGTPSATLAATVSTTPAAGTQETWSITFSGTWPAVGSTVGQVRLQLDSEYVILLSGTTTAGTQSVIVQRGAGGTIATHTSGTALYPTASAAALNNTVQLSPSAAQTGNINVTGTIGASNLQPNPMTQRGSLIAGGAVTSGVAAPTELVAGTAGEYLRSAGAGGDLLYAYSSPYMPGMEPTDRAETITMDEASTVSAGSYGSGQIDFAYFVPLKPLTVSTFSFAVALAGVGATMTLFRLGLYTVAADSSMALVALTASDLTLHGSTGQKTKPLTTDGSTSTTYTLLPTQRYAIAHLMTWTGSWTTAPTFVGQRSMSGLLNLLPYRVRSLGGQSSLPSTVAAAGTSATQSCIPWFALIV
jgi:hypothetical protein